MAWFGADPGGMGKFGVAPFDPDGSFKSAVVSCADQAIEWLAKTGASNDAAIAAREGADGRWVRNLAQSRSASQRDPTLAPWGPVADWRPED